MEIQLGIKFIKLKLNFLKCFRVDLLCQNGHNKIDVWIFENLQANVDI
jgi:hypothetical protein